MNELNTLYKKGKVDAIPPLHCKRKGQAEICAYSKYDGGERCCCTKADAVAHANCQHVVFPVGWYIHNPNVAGGTI